MPPDGGMIMAHRGTAHHGTARDGMARDGTASAGQTGSRLIVPGIVQGDDGRRASATIRSVKAAITLPSEVCLDPAGFGVPERRCCPSGVSHAGVMTVPD